MDSTDQAEYRNSNPTVDSFNVILKKTGLLDKQMMLSWLIGGIVCLFLLIGIEIISKRKGKAAIQVQSVALNRRAADVSRNDTIFVVLPMYRPQFAARVLTKIFDMAYCPQRVFVGILEHRLGGTETAIDAYTKELHSCMSPSFIRNIRYREGKMSHIYGASVARQEIMDNLYEDETFIFCIHEHSWLLRDWDKALIETLKVVHESGGHVLSQFPLELSMTDDELMFRNDHIPTTFPVFEKFRHGLPAFKGRFVDHYNPKPFQVAMASYRCLFTTAEVFKDRLNLAYPGIPYLTSIEADFLLSLELWTQGYQVFCPQQSVLIHHALPGEHFYSHQDVSNKKLKIIKKAIIRQLLHELPDPDEPLAYVKKLYLREKNQIRGFCDWLGVDVKKRHASGRVVMGLLPDYKDIDIIQKYGSMRQFEKFKNQFTY